jgi:hypothetical protein
LVAKEKEKKMTNKKNWLGMLVAILTFGILVIGCKSSGEAKNDGKGGSEPQRVGEKSILEWVKADGVYDIGDDATLQFMGETWVQSVKGSPLAAGSLTGMPGIPPGIDVAALAKTEEFVIQWMDFLNNAKDGEIKLTATMMYIGGKWQTMEQVDKLMSNPVASKTIPQEVKDAVAKFKQGLTFSYKFSKDPPFLVLSAK